MLAVTDIYATKGIEYLVTIGLLVLLVPYFIYLFRDEVRPAVRRVAERVAGWFELPEGLHIHRGHAWAAPRVGPTVRIGVDDFAGKLVGEPDALTLPRVGERIRAGAQGWSLGWGGRQVGMLAPVSGEVARLNPQLQADPGLVGRDPYGEGWLFEVRVPSRSSALNPLLSGTAARDWMDQSQARLQARMDELLAGSTGQEAAAFLQDGGLPVSGLARQVDPAHWDELAAELLLTAEGPGRRTDPGQG